jgi:hypothetical protein
MGERWILDGWEDNRHKIYDIIMRKEHTFKAARATPRHVTISPVVE